MSTTANYGFTKPVVAGDAGVWGGYLNTNFDSIDTILGAPRLPWVSPTVGATTTCDLTSTRVFAFTVSQATTLAFSNVPAGAVEVLLLITNGAAFTLTFPGSVTWVQGGTAGASFQSSGVDVVRMVTRDSGTTWYAWHLGKNLSLAGALRMGIGSATSVAKPNLVLYQNGALSTTSTSDVSLASYSLPANSLSANFNAIRITIGGTASVQPATINIKFGATSIFNTAGWSAGNPFLLTALVTRTGAATQLATGFCESHSGVIAVVRATPAETLSGAVTIDFRGLVTAGGTLFYDSVNVEYLAV